ncbi:MAG TPA: lysophospholipid acyltransferase family protein [Myxococcota bacterium]|nr:lysophospholipid acyltransferase family protein [Myxococcota bacterium]
MEEKILLYKPKNRGRLKKSPIYAANLVGKVLALCAKYLFFALRTPLNLATVDAYVEVFWRLNFQETFTWLYATGRERLSPGQTYIFMSNHESWMDIPAIFGAVPTSLRMVAKIGLMKIPLFGHALAKAGFIAVDRKNQQKAIKQLGEAKKRLNEGISIWIAPEGTRTRDGSIGPFKKGGFYLAKDLGVSIVPVFIEGAASVIPADSVVVRPNKSITVHFCEPVDAEVFGQMTTNDLVEKVRSSIINKRRECMDKKELIDGII